MSKGEWSEPEPYKDSETGADATIWRYRINGVQVGLVYHNRISFYAMSEVRRYGGCSTLEIAKLVVERKALIDLLQYPTMGSA
jgi:hypothetical protein